MNPSAEYTSETVRQAADGIIAARPSYVELITFYARIFAAQEDARLRISLPPVQLSDELLQIKRREQLPLVMTSEMSFDLPASENLLKEICRLTIDCGSQLAGTAQALSGQLAKTSCLFEPFLKAQESDILAAADGMGVAPNALAFFLYHSLRPSLCNGAVQLAAHLDPSPSGEQGYCPVCGSQPAIAWLEGEGQRYLFCSFCWHKWPLNRARCPFCRSRNQEGLLYLYSEEEKEYRVDACQSCRTYIKTVDTRFLGRPVYPSLEQVASLHLDLKAVEAGYQPGVPAAWPA
jgi:FdhE protein